MIKCPNCDKEVLYKSDTDNKTRLRSRMIVFNETLTKAFCVCQNCKLEVPIPIEISKVVKDELLYIPKNS